MGNCAIAADSISFVLSRTPHEKDRKLPKSDKLLVAYPFFQIVDDPDHVTLYIV